MGIIFGSWLIDGYDFVDFKEWYMDSLVNNQYFSSHRHHTIWCGLLLLFYRPYVYLIVIIIPYK